MAKFPSTFTAKFELDNPSKWVLGPLDEQTVQPLFHISSPEEPKQHVDPSKTKDDDASRVLYSLFDGPSKDDPVLATVTRKDRSITVTLPGTAGLPGHQVDIEVPKSKTDPITFEMIIDNAIEKFEWRRSKGKEVKESPEDRRGAKLVRMSGPESGAGGKRKERQFGYSSDGKEIVAVTSDVKHKTQSRRRFAFMGTGLTGAMGEIWETMAVVSGIYCFQGPRRLTTKEEVEAARAQAAALDEALRISNMVTQTHLLLPKQPLVQPKQK